jgi:hypothetical protein
VWRATAAVLVVGLLILAWAVSPTERRRLSVVARLEVGDSVSRVVELLGDPAARCPGGQVGHLQRSFPEGWPTAATETALAQLARETRERWVYPVGRGAHAGCAPRRGQTEVGVGSDGRVRWLIANTGKTPVRLPAEYAPGNPAPDVQQPTEK